jgi:hypothetical protein
VLELGNKDKALRAIPLSGQPEEALRAKVAYLKARDECGLLDDRGKLQLSRLLLGLNRDDAALVVILPLLSRTPPEPQALYIRGLLRLRKGNGDGVLDLLDAAGRRPMLMGRAVNRILNWLAGQGRAHDTAQLRAEMARLQAMHDEARAERDRLDGVVVLKPPVLRREDELLLRDALAPLAGDVLLGWLAQRPCDRLPRWRHHEILLETRPGLLWPPHHARKRLKKLEKAARSLLPELPDTTLSVRLSPLRAPAWFRRQMRRAAGRPFLTDLDAPAPAS